MAQNLLFIFGNTPHLGRAELSAILKSQNIKVNPSLSAASADYYQLPDEFDLEKIFNTLGGCVKVCAVERLNVKYGDLSEEISSIFKFGERVEFGISYLDKNKNKEVVELSKKVKKILKSRGSSVRFVLPQDSTISTVVVRDQKITEIVLCPINDEEFLICRTLLVQDYNYWSTADYQRPCADPKGGMLPPKISRIMVNLCAANMSKEKEKYLLDPFCGMGTILQEALFLGFNVLGSDVSAEIIKKTRKNIDWYKERFGVMKSTRIFAADALKLDVNLPINSIDCLVTEGDMGEAMELRGDYVFLSRQKRKVDVAFIKENYEKVMDLYLSGLKEWRKILKNKSYVCIIFPSYHLPNTQFDPVKIIDNLVNLGYSIKDGPLSYSRPNAIVRRNIYLLQFNK